MPWSSVRTRRGSLTWCSTGCLDPVSAQREEVMMFNWMPWSSVRTRRGSYDVQLDALIQCPHKERKFNIMFNLMPWTRFCIKCGIHSWVHWSSLCTRTIQQRRFNRMFSWSLDTGWAQGERSDMALNWVSWCKWCPRRGRLMSCSAGCHNAVCVTALKLTMLFNMVNLKCWVH